MQSRSLGSLGEAPPKIRPPRPQPHSVMRRLVSAVLLLPTLASLSLRAADSASPLLDQAGNPAGFRTLALGEPAPDFSLPGIDGRTHTLQEFAGPEVLMVIFTSNHCPTAHAVEHRLQKLRTDLRGRSFALVA